MIFEWSGGAHCCYTVHVFEIGPRFHKIASLSAENGGLDFEGLAGDGSLAFVFHDWTFAYWPTSFAFSPAPRIVLRFKRAAYRLAPEFMRKPPASDGWMREKTQEVLEDEWADDKAPPKLWGYMLDLIYSGLSH